MKTLHAFALAVQCIGLAAGIFFHSVFMMVWCTLFAIYSLLMLNLKD